MATQGDRQSVLRTAKVRTILKGDNSWIQQSDQFGAEEEAEKPWIAEVRARQLSESDPVVDTRPPEREPQSSPSTDSQKTSGYLIRGVFTKTDTKQATSSANGYIATSGFTKKSSEGYKKIAPHTVRSTMDRTEPSESSLSAEEQEKRTEAASKTVTSSAIKQRSYVLSAAKKYETTPEKPDIFSSPDTAFKAKRVIISEDDDTGYPLSSSVSFSEHSVEMSVDEPIPPEPYELKPRSQPEPKPKQSNTLSALSDTLLSTTESTSNKQVTQNTSPSRTTTVSKLAPNPKTSAQESISQAPPVAPVAFKKSEPKPDSTTKTSIKPKPVENTSALNDNDFLDLNESSSKVDPTPTTTDLLTGGCLPKTDKTKGSLDLLAHDIISIDTNTDKLSTNKTNTRVEVTQTVVQTKTDVKSTPQNLVNPAPTTTDLLTGGLSTNKTNTRVEVTQTVVQTKTDVKSIKPKPVENTGPLSDNDFMDLNESTPQNLVNPAPTTTDLMKGGCLPKTDKTKGSLDLLAHDIISIDTNTDKLSTKTNTKVEITQTVVQTKTDVKSVNTSKNLNSISTTTTDLLIGSSLPQTKKASESLDLLAHDIIPFDTSKKSISTNKTQSKVETTTTVIQTKTINKGSADPFDSIGMVKESTKSPVELFDPLLSDSAPERQPTDYTYTAYSTEERIYQEPDTETKKNLVYVKSYVDSSDPFRYSTSRYDTDYDYVTSSSSSYAYSSPSSNVGMTACTYCGGLVGNDSKITIEHLNISCHPDCFKCGICSKPMGDFIHSMFLHRGMVHCEDCYSNVI